MVRARAYCWVCIVELDGYLVREFFPAVLSLFESTNNVIQGRRTPKVLLLQTQLLSTIKIVIWVQNGRNGICALLVRHGAFIVTRIKFCKVKLSACCLARPQSQVVGSFGPVSGNGYIIRHGLDNLAILPRIDSLALLILILPDPTVELDIDRHIMAREFPRVEIQPVIGNFYLVAIYDLLLENPIAVSESVAPGWVV